MTFLQKKTLSSSSFSPFGFLERLKRSKRREEVFNKETIRFNKGMKQWG